MTIFVNVLISRNTDRLFTYNVPDQLEPLIEVGKTVSIPFRNRQMTGFVVEIVDRPDYKLIRDISSIENDPIIFNKDAVSIAHQISEHYQCSFLSALYLYLPPSLDKKNKQVKVVQDKIKMVTITVPPHEAAELSIKYKASKKTEQMADVLALIVRAGGALPYSEIEQKSSLKSLLSRHVVQMDEVLISRLPQNADHKLSAEVSTAELTQAQQHAVSEILSGRDDLFLLHGVTGSGKTEVYLRVIADALEKGQGAIVLVPEISLTPQTLSRFYRRFGDTVAVMHSSLGERDRAIQWYKVLSGECRIVVGARSALFAPMKDLGVIIIDEEHEGSYKQESNPRYSAVTVAGWIARKYSALLILGSATPAIERYYYAKEGFLKIITLPERVSGPVSSEIIIVDMRAEQEAGYSGMFSRALIKAAKVALENKEQIMLLLNRRGFAPFVICKSCGYKLTCPNCEVSLTLHNDNMLYCHYCGYSAVNKPYCPECNNLVFRYSGVGTQKLEAELHSFFPKARVLRMDRDSTSRLGSMEAILGKFAAGEADVLIGTQMIAKGHDFDNVGLVGVVSADVALSLPDFRAAERTYTLLSQVAGRTGRRGKPGKVLIQTFNPENYAIAMVKEDNYDNFYEKEIDFRRMLDYPPFVRLCRIIFQAYSTGDMQKIADIIDNYFADNKPSGIEIYGPMPAPIEKIANKYRWHMIIKSKSVQGIQKVVKSLKSVLETADKSVSWVVDVDPVNLL